MSDCAHTGSFYIEINPDSCSYYIATDDPLTVRCATCDKEFKAEVKVILPPKCMIGAEHTTADCPLSLPIAAHTREST